MMGFALDAIGGGFIILISSNGLIFLVVEIYNFHNLNYFQKLL